MTHSPQPTSLPPMEWYPDPADPSRDRYWDGQQWTHNTRPTKAAAPAHHGPVHRPGPAGGASSWQQAPAAATRPATTADGVPLGGWWPRAAALVLDNLLISFLLSMVTGDLADQVMEPYMRWVRDMSATTGAVPDPASYGFIEPMTKLVAIQALTMIVYHALMLARFGATLGKMAAGLRVVPLGQGRHTGGIGLGRAIVRALMLTICLVTTLPMLLVALLPATTSGRRSPQDYAARTQVVRSR